MLCRQDRGEEQSATVASQRGNAARPPTADVARHRRDGHPMKRFGQDQQTDLGHHMSARWEPPDPDANFRRRSQIGARADQPMACRPTR